MKDQYFADRRDFFKWDFLEDLLDGCEQLKTLTNIVMLTPSDNPKEGNLKIKKQGSRRERLYKFLQSCSGSKRRVSAMRNYFKDKEDKRIQYHPHEIPYEYKHRKEYFKKVPQK